MISPETIYNAIRQNFGTKLISLIIACVLWGIVLGLQRVEDIPGFPLEVVTPSDLTVANDLPDKIYFRVSGPRGLLRTIGTRCREPVVLDLSHALPGLTNHRILPEHLPCADKLKLVQVVAVNPTAVLIKLEYIKRREVPVTLDLRGAPPAGYRLGKSEVHPSAVRIKGPESRVDAVATLSSAPIDLNGLTETTEREVPLDLARHHVQLDGPPPRMRIEVEPTSANFRIKNVDIRVLSPYKSTLDTKTVTVEVRSPEKELQIDETQVSAAVDLRDKPKGEHTAPVKVTLPEQVSLVRVIPETVKVTLH